MTDVEILEIIKDAIDLIELDPDMYGNGSNIAALVTDPAIRYIDKKIENAKIAEKNRIYDED